MGLLSAIFGSDRAGQHDRPDECAHERLVGRWRAPDVMDDDARAMGFICQDCGREFLSYRVANRKVIGD